MVSVAMHDALNGIEPKYERYASPASDPRAAPVAAAAQAAHDVLVALFPDRQEDLDAKLVTSLSILNDDDAKARGIALGKAAAADLLSVRANDGSNVVVSYTPIAEPGYWRPTPPAFAPALEPGWGNVTPWGLESGSQFRSRAPYALTSAEYAADFIEVRDYGSAGSTFRSSSVRRNTPSARQVLDRLLEDRIAWTPRPEAHEYAYRGRLKFDRLLAGIVSAGLPEGGTSPSCASWNQMAGWLRQVEGLRRAA